MTQVFKQDLTDNSVRPGGLFFVELLMPKQCDMPNRLIFSQISAFLAKIH